MKVEFEDLRNTGRDRFGRDFPLEITLENNQVVLGHAVVTNYGVNDEFHIDIFKVIENLEDWKTNKIQVGTRNISIKKRDIKEMVIFKDY